MLRLILPAILLLFIYSCCNNKKPAPLSTQLFLGASVNHLDSPNIIYYPYYDGIQMIEIDYFSPWLIRKNAYSFRYLTMPATSSDPMLHYPEPKRNAFILRDKQDKVISHYNFSKAELEAIVFIQTADSIPIKTIFHKQKSPALLLGQTTARPTYLNTLKEEKQLFRYYIETEKGMGLIDTFGKLLLDPIYQNIYLLNSCYYLTKDHKIETRS